MLANLKSSLVHADLSSKFGRCHQGGHALNWNLNPPIRHNTGFSLDCAWADVYESEYNLLFLHLNTLQKWLNHLKGEKMIQIWPDGWCLIQEVSRTNQTQMLTAQHEWVQKDDFFLNTCEYCLIPPYLLLQAAAKIQFKCNTGTGTGCSERLWIIHPWRHSKPDWIQSWDTYSSWPWLSRGVQWDNLQICLPTPRILQFYD